MNQTSHIHSLGWLPSKVQACSPQSAEQRSFRSFVRFIVDLFTIFASPESVTLRHHQKALVSGELLHIHSLRRLLVRSLLSPFQKLPCFLALPSLSGSSPLFRHELNQVHDALVTESAKNEQINSADGICGRKTKLLTREIC